MLGDVQLGQLQCIGFSINCFSINCFISALSSAAMTHHASWEYAHYTALTFLLLLPSARLSIKRRVNFQNLCWSPSSANTGPLAGSQNSGNRISTCIACLTVSLIRRLLQSLLSLTMHLLAPFCIASAVASLACCRASPRLSGNT